MGKNNNDKKQCPKRGILCISGQKSGMFEKKIALQMKVKLISLYKNGRKRNKYKAVH